MAACAEPGGGQCCVFFQFKAVTSPAKYCSHNELDGFEKS